MHDKKRSDLICKKQKIFFRLAEIEGEESRRKLSTHIIKVQKAEMENVLVTVVRNYSGSQKSFFN